ncbi:hypothetical protein MPRF_34370 [Mycolicibacterium parafortuitum]|uniref:Uncharacterized protein n=2 Tax=Mycolicibacterium parafortuitum TaxID=39692 RepID=A0A7I7U5A3_MYCPF|nr:hypothetical protein [Mycolicibacterium parafortuitum]PQD99897.1 hypothetical protein CYL16_13720 [Mycobacterium sp. EPG1]BBY76538.1 hypothetical protein MPRF_34370 [Mycolicibacterium parafortuitum]
MEMKRIAAGVVTVSALGLGGLGLGAGMALADPPAPNPNPGPGVNIGGPGNPAPPGLGHLPPPGHGGPMPQNRILLPAVPAWVVTPVVPPLDAPPRPDVPDWADGLSIVWNPDLSAWGVWNGDQGVFIRL